MSGTKGIVSRNAIYTVLGDSMVRTLGDCLANKNSKWTRICLDGAKIEDVWEALNKTKDKMDKLLIWVGRNDVGCDRKEVVLDKMCELLHNAVSKSNEVYVIGILPTNWDTGKAIKDIVWINKNLKMMVELINVTFIDLWEDMEFKWYAEDGINLNYIGAKQVCRICNFYINARK